MAGFPQMVEVNLYIFENLSRQDLRRCQTVCKSWYKPARILLLKTVRLRNNKEVEAFLDSLARDPSYFKHIKKLELGAHNEAGSLDPFRAQRLFVRLTDIKELEILSHNIFMKLVKSPSARNILKTHCKKLGKLSINTLQHSPEYTKLISDWSQELKNSLKYKRCGHNETPEAFAVFHHLEEIHINNSTNWTQWLPLFEQKSNLKKLHYDLYRVDEDGFMENFLQSKTENEQTHILKTLAKIKSLHIDDSILCENSIQFIAQYFTGLQDLVFVNQNGRSLTDSQLDVFYTTLLDLATRLKSSHIDIWAGLADASLARCIQPVFEKMYKSLPNVQSADTLKVFYMPTSRYGGIYTDLKKINERQVERVVEISFEMDLFLWDYIKGDSWEEEEEEEDDEDDYYDEILDDSEYLEREAEKAREKAKNDQAATEDIQAHEFVMDTAKRDQVIMDQIESSLANSYKITTINFAYNHFCPPTYMSIFHQLLNKLPVVKQVQIHFPGYQFNYRYDENVTRQYPQVEKLELSTSCEMEKNYLFARMMPMFPNVKYLKLYYFTGIWNKLTNQYTIPLQNVKLERLYLDVTAVLKKAKDIKIYKDSCRDDDDGWFEEEEEYGRKKETCFVEKQFDTTFFTLHVKQRVYKVTFTDLRVTRMDNVDEVNNHSLQVHVSLADLQYLHLYLRNFTTTNDYMNGNMDNVMESKISFLK